MKFNLALSGVVLSTGVVVFSAMNIYLPRQWKLIIGSSSFLMGSASVAVLAKNNSLHQSKLDKEIQSSASRINALERDKEELLQTISDRIAKATQDKNTRILDLESLITKLEGELKHCDIRVDNAAQEIANRYESEMSVVKQQLATKFNSELEAAIAVSEELRDQLAVNHKKLEYFYSRENNIIDEERRLNDIKKQLNLYKEQLKISQEKSALDVEKALLAEKEKFDELVRANELYKHQLLKYQERLAQVESENTNLKNSSKLRIAHGASYEAYLSQVIQNCYIENEINIAFAEFSKYGDTLIFKFYLVDSTKASKALKINKSLELSTGKFCHTEIKNGYLVVKTDNEKTRDIKPIKVKNSAEVKRNYCWLDDTFVKSHHDIIIGATGRGKSTLVDNIAALANIHFGGNAEIYVIDPKYPLTEWVFGGEKFKPQYKGMNAINENFQTSIDGLNDMVRSLQNRLDSATIAAENDDVLPEMNPQIWVVDESLLLRDADKELHSKAINLLSRVGRALKIRIILLTQESNTAPNGLTISGSFNFTRYYLGDSAKVPSVLNREIKSALEKNEITAKTTELIERGEKYFGLICPGEEKPFMEVLPPPGFYTNQLKTSKKEAVKSNELEEDDLDIPPKSSTSSHTPKDDILQKHSLYCPRCESDDILKNGTRESKKGTFQKYRCKDCFKQFSVKLKDAVKV